ncbi:MAG: ferredoxin family protein [Pseudomonadota bacterium]
MSESEEEHRNADGGRVSPRISLFPAWCKRCGNCVEFCPRHVLASDEWGYPFVARPERCTGCRLCEMLCPDFAIGMGGPDDAEGAGQDRTKGRGRPMEAETDPSPERLAPAPEYDEEKNGGKEP